MPQMEEQEGLLEAEFEEDIPLQGEGPLDALSRQFGAAPWWVISGAFHSLVILLVTLIVAVAVRAAKEDVRITSVFEREKPPVNEEVKHDILETIPIKSELDPVINPVVFHELTEVAEHVETDDQMDDSMAHGDEDSISDVPLGGVGFAAGIGLGGDPGGAYGHRSKGGRKRLAGIHGGGGTQSSVEDALKWLANHQEADGHWDTVKYGGKKADVSMTGLALLAFLGAGHTEKVGKYN